MHTKRCTMYDVRCTKKSLPAARRGFTLIELLVVIAIIAVLVAFAVANFVGARSRARDVKKKSELQQVKNALRLYYNDYQVYPETAPAPATNTFKGCGVPVPPAKPTATCTDAFTAGTNVYMKLLPPVSAYVWNYAQESSGDDFCLWATLENQSDSEIANSQKKCSSCSVVSSDYVLCAD